MVSGASGSVDLAAVRKQVEYYFSDSNLPRDKFLRAKTEENEGGFVDIAVLLTFNRLAALCGDVGQIAAALAASDVVALDATRTRVRRAHPLPDTPEWRNRAVYAKGWDADGQEPTIEDVTELFSPSGEVLSVRLRRWKDDTGRHFKGSIFAEFATAEAAERAAAEDYAIDVKGPDGRVVSRVLEVLPVEAYLDRKRREAKERRAARGKGCKKPGNGAPNGAAPRARRSAKAEDEVAGEGDAVKAEKVLLKEEEKLQKKRELVPGMVLRFVGFGPDVSREDIKEAFESYGDVGWVDFRRGDAEGHVRFTRQGAAESAVAGMAESKTEFGGKLPTFSVLGGAAEEAYWKETWEKQDAVADRSKKRRREDGRGFGKKRRRGGGFGRGRGSGRGRGRA